jgi:hypothetical protein
MAIHRAFAWGSLLRLRLPQIVIIGGWAHRLFRYHPLAQAVQYEPLLTLDTDVALPIRLEVREQDLRDRLASAGASRLNSPSSFSLRSRICANWFERLANRTLYVISELIQNVLDGLALQDLILQLVHPNLNLTGSGGLE